MIATPDSAAEACSQFPPSLSLMQAEPCGDGGEVCPKRRQGMLMSRLRTWLGGGPSEHPTRLW